MTKEEFVALQLWRGKLQGMDNDFKNNEADPQVFLFRKYWQTKRRIGKMKT